MRMEKEIKPPLLRLLQDRSWASLEVENLSNGSYQGSPVKPLLIPAQTVDSTSFTGCDFSRLSFEKIDFMDGLFRNDLFLNLDFSKGYFGRVAFAGSNLLGVKFVGAALFDVSFEDCNLSYANFSEADLRSVRFHHCRMDESFFEATRFKNVHFEKCSLLKSDFFKTPLKDIDLSSDDIAGLHIEPASLSGVIISSEQAVQLAPYFGLVIKA